MSIVKVKEVGVKCHCVVNDDEATVDLTLRSQVDAKSNKVKGISCGPFTSNISVGGWGIF